MSGDLAGAEPRLGRRPAGGLHHLLAALAALLVLVASAVLALVLLARAAGDPQHAGPLLAFFPPGWPAESVLLATARAESTVRGEGWLPGLVEVVAAEPGLAARLEREGAVLVLATLPFDFASLTSCAGVVRTAPPRPVQTL
jgi:hypothetical protein